ncbi:hypothetical protein VKT23_019775 [Stygiomarasmius scandens]|uniref:Uncharacterized protein n=1 Tax=Marasmiellus scandens TaxID=2682957 RepID=A0ABR1IKM0_9AGAR
MVCIRVYIQNLFNKSLGTLSVGFLVVSMAVADLMTDMEDMILLLAAILQVQVIDSSEFSSMDFDSYKTTVSYFHKICKPMLVTPGYALPEAVDTFFEDLRDLDYAEVSGEDTRDKMHGVMRDAAKEVHELLFKSREEPALAAQELIKVIRKALEMVILELQAHFDQGLSEWLKALKENEGDKAATLKERGYDIIG